MTRQRILRAAILLIAVLTVLLALAATEGSRPLFMPAVTYSTGASSTFSVAVADVNGDGKPDLLVANQNCGDCEGVVSVLLGNGDGTFQPLQTYDSGGHNAFSIAVADVNGDGKPDLLVANLCTLCANGVIGVLLGNGDGTFQAAQTYNSGGIGAHSVAVADVNGDGKPDLLVAIGCEACSTGGVSVLLGNGDGTFQPAKVYYSGGSDASSVAVADVNGDRKPDLLVANEGGTGLNGSVAVLLGNGDGTFQAAVSYSSGGKEASSLAVADVNGDNKLDLLVADVCLTIDCPSGAAGVLLGNGDGTFQAVKTYSSGSFLATSIAVADVNGDNKPDLLVANWGPSNPLSNVSVLLGNGDGTFQKAQIYNSGGQYANAIAAADVNGDGKIDLLVANEGGGEGGTGAVGVLLNNALPQCDGGCLTSTTLASSLNPSIYGQKVTWTATVTPFGSVSPTGKVNFKWDGYSIGTTTLNANGVATLSKSNLNVYTYPLTAVYLGDQNNVSSTSAVVNQVVKETTSAATISSSVNPSTQGQAVSFTATITSPTAVPTGPVNFTAGTMVLGTAPLSGGKAKFTISTLVTGSTKVTATYNGDSNIAESSASVTQTVRP
jgi:hypothetical protein